MKILVYPKDTNNPYQSLLYSGMTDVTIKYLQFPTKSKIVGLIFVFFILPYYRLQGYSIVHIHWLYELGFIFKNKFLNFLSQTFFFIYSILFFTFLKVLGFKIVWTVHNVTTHEKQTLNDVAISRYLAALSSALIVHSPETISKLKHVGIEGKTHIIPHGNYNGHYPNSLTREQAREKLQIGNKLTFLYFGQIRRYKGVDTLINVFTKLNEDDMQLVIAGSCNDPELKQTIEKAVKENPESIYFFPNYIPNDQIQRYYNAADCVVLPFKHITTSGSVLLSFAFKKPLIFPDIGNMKEFPDTIGFKYDHQQEDGLEKALKAAINHHTSLKQLGEAGFEYSQRFAWEPIQKKLLNVYTEALAE